MEFISSNVLKGIVVDKGRIVSAYLQNKITGNKINQGACECGVSYFVKTGILTKKAYFDSSQMEVKNTFANKRKFRKFITTRSTMSEIPIKY